MASAAPVTAHHDPDLLAALGPLGSCLSDERVTDLLVNGVAGVWVDRGSGVERVATELTDPRSVRRLAVRLASLAGQRLDESSPFVDGLLPGGVRLHALLPPIADGGAHVSLRIPRRVVPGLADLERWGALDPFATDLLRRLIAARVSFVVSGGTGSGKTTLLAALLSEVARDERIVVAEDTRELRIAHPHVVHLQGRANNVEGRGEVTMVALVRQTLRMRPDRVVVGEVRGAEVRELLSALNTGHEGGCGTVHANTVSDAVSRFEALGALAGMSVPALHAQLASAIRVVVHVDRAVDGRRHLAQIGVLERGEDGRVRGRPALTGAPGRWRRGGAWGALQDLLGEAP